MAGAMRIVPLGGSIPAGEDLSTYYGYCMAIVAGEIQRSAQAATAMLGHCGILWQPIGDNYTPTVATWGSQVPAKCKGTGIVVGTLLSVDVTDLAANRAKLYMAIDGGWVCGVALQACGTDDGIVLVQLIEPAIVADVSLWGVGNA